MNIETWLTEIGLERYTAAFAENGVEQGLLPELTNEDLKDLGVERLADRKTILKSIARLSEGEPAAEAPAAPILAGERRQVTILFADIAGFTELSSALDAEELHGLLSRFFDAADTAIENYGGTVDKHMGDAVMALFGAPVAHGDDPLRAVRAAFDIHGAMETLSAELGRELRVHVGIASGEVVAGGLGSAQSQEYTVLGDSVNLASRLDGLAEAGQTLIAEAVRRAVLHDVDCEALGEVAVKGLDKPVPVWRARGLAEEVPAGARGPLVGRKSELRQFAGVLEACREAGAGQTVVLRGEAGIGKTRLVEEFAALALAQGFTAHKSLVLDFGVGKGQDAIRSLLRSLLGLPGNSAEAARAQAATDAIAGGWLEPDQRVFLNDLLDLAQPIDLRGLYDAMDNDTRNRGKRDVVAALIEGASGRSPLLLMIEDAHWADALTLSHLARITATVRNCTAVLVTTTRIEGDPLDNAWRAETGGAPLLTIDLAPLREAEAIELAAGLLEINEQIARDCIARAEGNPLFLEQLLRNAEESSEEAVPASIQSLVLARMDRLLGPDKAALQAASVIGQRFSLDVLRHLIEDPGYDCGGLVAHHVLRPEGGAYLFAHALIRDGVYASLLNTRKRELHANAAHWYAEDDPVLHAEHLDRAEDPAAPMAYLDAAKAQTAELHFETALRLTDRGIELTKDPATKVDLMCIRGDTLRDMGATEQSIAAFEMALDSAGDDVHRCRAWIGMADGLRVADRPTPALEALDKAEVAATNHGLLSERAQIHYLRGNVYFPLGNIDGCLEEHEKALSFAREVGSTEGEALALGGLGDAYYLRSHMRTAYEQFRTCVGVCREHGYRRIEVANRHMMGWSRIYLMEFAEALKDARESAKIAAEVSHRRAEMLGLILAGRVELELGQFVEAQEYLERGLELARTISASNFETHSLIYLARSAAAQGELPKARDYAQRAVGVVREIGMTFIGPTVLAHWAAVSENPDERRKALEEAEHILDSGCVAHNHFWFAQTAIDLALTIGEWDEAERYATRLETYTREQPLPWPDFMIARGRALAAWGQGRRGTELVAELKRLRAEAEQVSLMTAVPALDEALHAARRGIPH